MNPRDSQILFDFFLPQLAKTAVGGFEQGRQLAKGFRLSAELRSRPQTTLFRIRCRKILCGVLNPEHREFKQADTNRRGSESVLKTGVSIGK